MKGETERTRALSLQKHASTPTCACSYRQASCDGLREIYKESSGVLRSVRPLRSALLSRVIWAPTTGASDSSEETRRSCLRSASPYGNATGEVNLPFYQVLLKVRNKEPLPPPGRPQPSPGTRALVGAFPRRFFFLPFKPGRQSHCDGIFIQLLDDFKTRWGN